MGTRLLSSFFLRLLDGHLFLRANMIHPQFSGCLPLVFAEIGTFFDTGTVNQTYDTIVPSKGSTELEVHAYIIVIDFNRYVGLPLLTRSIRKRRREAVINWRVREGRREPNDLGQIS